MRFTTALTAFFFVLFALFSTMAYAAPVAPQGVMVKRQCDMSGCRDAVTPQTGSGSTSQLTALNNFISSLLALMGNTGGNKPNDNTTSTTVTAASTSAAPASNPTGV